MSGPSFWALSAAPAAAGLVFTGAAWAAQTNFGRNPKRRRPNPPEGAVPDTPDMEEGELQPRRLFTNGQSHGILKRRINLGRKETYDRKMRKIQKASERALVYAFRGINTMDGVTGSNKGYFNLYHGPYTGSNVASNQRGFPFDVFNLTAIPQGGVVAVGGDFPFNAAVPLTAARTDVCVPWKLCCDTTSNVWSWQYGQPGETNTTGVTSRTWTPEKITNFNIVPGNTTPVPGHSAYLDWVRARFMVYGRKKEESRVRIQLIQFTRDEFCPEYDIVEGQPNVGDNVTRLSAVATNFVKGMINNPIVTKTNNTKEKFFNVLFTKELVIPPKMTDDENDDPLKVQFDMFKRMNKLIKYSLPTSTADTIDNIVNEEFVGAPSTGFRAQPTRLSQNVYLMISSWDPRLTSTPTTEYQTTYDLNLRKRHTVEYA